MMLRTTIAGALLIGTVATSPPAAAGDVSWGFHVGIGGSRGSVHVGYDHRARYERTRYVPGVRRYVPRRQTHHVAPPARARRHQPLQVYRVQRHRHVPMPVYEEVWIEPIYRTVFCGYDEWDRPVYRRVLVTAGHYRRVTRYHACRGCGARLP